MTSTKGIQTSLILGIGVAAVAIASVIGYFAINAKPDLTKPVHPNDQILLWICVAKNETHDFTTTVSDMASGTLVCPVCGSDEISRALPCPKCGRHYPTSRYNVSPEYCLYCNERLPGADISTFHDHGGH